MLNSVRTVYESLLNRLRSFVLIAMLACSLAGFAPDRAQAAGTTFYVDNTNPNCSNASTGPQGTADVPFCSLARGALKAINPGDTVRVIAGTYAETIYPNGGTEGNPISFLANPGVTVTGQPGTATVAYSAFAISTRSYVVIDGFNITQTSSKGIYVDQSDHITIRNNHVSYAGASSLFHPYEQGIYLKSTTNSTITNNVTDHNTCIGIRLVNNSNNNLVSNNISYSNFSVVETDAAGIEMTGSSYNTIVNNVTYSNEDSGINIYANSSNVPSSYNLVIGNVSYENGDHGIDHYGSPYNTVVGNTVQGNGTVGINFEGPIGMGSHHAIAVNNIMSGNGFTPPTGSFGGNLRVDSNSTTGSTIDYNLFNRESAGVQIIWNSTPFMSLAAFHAMVSDQEVHGIEGDPLFVDPVPSALRQTGVPYEGAGIVGDYHLSAGSPAIDSANADAPSQPSVDIEGTGRADDPDTINTGAGVRSYDDRGAFEFQPETAACYALSLGHSGQGLNPVASPSHSTGCLLDRYIEGATINLSGVSPATGWRISGWTGTDNNSSEESTNVLTMPGADHSALVNYSQIDYSLTLATVGQGTITADVSAPYHYGNTVHLTAVPQPGWTFTGWSGNLTGTSNPGTLTVQGNSSVTATFADQSAPTISSIERADPDYTLATSVRFTVTFSEPVIDVDSADFTLNATGAITGATVSGVTGAGAVRTVTVNTGSGNGTLGLRVPVDATIKDLNQNALSGLPYLNGQVYAINKLADINVYVGGSLQKNYLIAPGVSTRDSYLTVNSGPVKLTNSNPIPLLASERVVYKVGRVATSFSEMMGLPANQLDTTYWLPWYNNVDLDTQIRFANVNNTPTTVHVFVAGVERGMGFTLKANESTRQSFTGLNNGPVKIVSDLPIVAAERVIYKVQGKQTSFSEMMALPASQLDKTYWLPWYNNVDLDTQIRFANTTGEVAHVHIYIGGQEMGDGFTLQANESTRQSFPTINSGPVKIVSDQPIVAAERVIYKVNGVNTSFTEMMALPAGQVDTTYWLPWYNNVDLDTQIRFANTTDQIAHVHIYIGGQEMGDGFTLKANESTRQSFPTINSGPVEIRSDVPIVASERVVYKVSNVNTSFCEMMGLPSLQLDHTYWLPWYNNVDLDTQLRFGVPK